MDYERMTRRQRLRVEIRQAKSEVEFYQATVHHNAILERKEARQIKRVSKSKLSAKLTHEFGVTSTSNLVSKEGTATGSSRKSIDGEKPVRSQERVWEFSQTETDQQYAQNKRKRLEIKHGSNKKRKTSDVVKKAAENTTLLKTLFSGGLKDRKDGD